MKVTIKSIWNTVSAWHWDVNEECCGICRMAFDGCCVDCKIPGDDCPPVWGVCNHAFHMHCILKWLNANELQQCPMCRSEWRFKSDEK
ncbi:anaphase promoting complex subunit 11 [Dictyostelium discoideum AX4]|uniref:Anaphase-promoting complex subunit 11 n=1 Tax=Dictyostelium discoideum TaxID=44689 RepID=APC11_DICDI|nr:anaphase promoting complex subunit 11 [Dictyostelium discoideum AX4]Q54L48.1 RecName: Full=Anaphase-promoting complex subunit 11; Short=APC11 [Dictyostelium discoideum]EAL63952.1 anaphase promoting complex subunit 11 [Dictyostelium discoideum AX4]|eukprot:XP_637455.1 anaphase promoting complex subunit 11 [Dictyostelium discoideum AX4]